MKANTKSRYHYFLLISHMKNIYDDEDDDDAVPTKPNMPIIFIIHTDSHSYSHLHLNS